MEWSLVTEIDNPSLVCVDFWSQKPGQYNTYAGQEKLRQLVEQKEVNSSLDKQDFPSLISS